MAQRCNSRNNTRGFTILELVVAIGLFSIILTIAVGGFVRVLRTQREAAALLGANSAASLALEQIAREVRTGHFFCNGEETPGCDCVDSGSCVLSRDIWFVNAEGRLVIYRLLDGVIERSIDGNVNFEPITPSNVFVDHLFFAFFGNRRSDGFPPRITISLGAGIHAAGTGRGIINLQTTVSARLIDT